MNVTQPIVAVRPLCRKCASTREYLPSQDKNRPRANENSLHFQIEVQYRGSFVHCHSAAVSFRLRRDLTHRWRSGRFPFGGLALQIFGARDNGNVWRLRDENRFFARQHFRFVFAIDDRRTDGGAAACRWRKFNLSFRLSIASGFSSPDSILISAANSRAARRFPVARQGCRLLPQRQQK
jgi:hypothetical protein